MEVSEAGSGADARGALAQQPWQLLLLDIRLPDVDGVELLEQVRAATPDVRVLIFSMCAADRLSAAIRRLAAGYLWKGSAHPEIIRAVEQVLAGGRYFPLETLERIGANAHAHCSHERLSSRESQVLRLIGSGRTSSEIAKTLDLSIGTVSTYRERILDKMGLETNAQLMHYAIKHRLVE